MKIKIFRYTLNALIGVLLHSCSVNPNIPHTSTDINELGKYINLEGHKPLQVKWSYEKLGNQSDSRIPGPNDYKLEAVLQFNSKTIEEIKEKYKLLSVSFRELRKEQFRFEWLDKKNLHKLNKTNYLFYYHPNIFKKASFIHGGYTIIDETRILLSLHSM